MKEIIPLKKDIIFKSKISEITTIDVEHDYKIKDNVVEGKIFITGNYKMTQASLTLEDFYYEVPFSIAIADNIKKDTINIEISDFKYDYDKDIMKINATLEFTCDKEESHEDIFDNLSNEEYFKDNIILDDNKEEIEDNNFIQALNDNNLNIESDSNNKVIIKENVNEVNNDIEIGNITDSVVSNDKNYNVYKVYIVRQGDNIENICAKYNVKYNDIKDYNNLNEINVGDKIIIPYINE